MPPRRFFPLAFLASFAALTPACAPLLTNAAPVPLEDGTTAYDIRCGRRGLQCTTQAATVCGGDDTSYVVLERDWSIAPGNAYQEGVMRIQCRAEYEERQPYAARVGTVVPPLPINSRLVCSRAFDDVAETAKVWSAERHMPERTSAPDEESFLGTCRALPDRAELCLSGVYREYHQQLCADTLHALGGKPREALDELLLEHPSKSI
jgi:hypothetical protein